MEDWKYIQTQPTEKLARLHFFSIKKPHAGGEVELRITVREYITAEIGDLLFYAEADRDLNQRTAPFRPCGWGSTLSAALSECIRNIRRFEYEGPEKSSTTAAE